MKQIEFETFHVSSHISHMNDYRSGTRLVANSDIQSFRKYRVDIVIASICFQND